MDEAKVNKPVVKREVVSINNAVVVDTSAYSMVSYQMNNMSCKKCLKERAKGNQRWRQQKFKHKPTKSNTPIVIQLKDTLKVALRQKQRTLSETLIRSKVKDSVEDIGNKDSLTNLSKDSHDSASTKQLRTKKDVKNLSALISVIEKSHEKDTSNFTKNAKNSSREVANFVLNNAIYSVEDIYDINKRRSIVECDNVDVICNDLNSSEKSSVIGDTESENGSTISSSENQSDTDVSGSVALETSDFELPKGEELEQLARYTTGCPLIRYDCPPSECPQCQAELYSTQYYYGMYQDDFYKYSSQYEDGQSVTMETQSTKDKDDEMSSLSVDSVDIVTTESGDSKTTTNTPTAEFQNNNTLTTTENNAQNNPDRNPNIVCCSQSKTTSSTQTQRQLLDIDITTRRGGSGGSRDTLCTDSVYIDLTDTDVTYTVYYDHDLSQSDKENSNYAITTDSYPTTSFSSSMSSSSMNQALSFTTTCYMPVPYWYWPYMYSPMHSLSFPSNYHPDSIPKKLMIPPEELRAFNTSQPPARQWMWLATPERNRPTAIYTVMCYNVLCDKYCTRQIYGYCPSWALNWEYRKKGIIEEIKHFAADIISLQEVETDQFYNFFLPELKAEGYDGIFSPKSRARTMTESDRKHVDGCAIFFRKTKFSLVKEHLIEFNQLAMANAEGSDDMLNRVMTKDNIGLAALLETKEGVYENGSPPEGQVKQPILVATAHIHWDPEFSDVKLIQTMMLMWELKQIISDCTQSFRPGSNISTQQDVNTIPLILCGDLNSLPDSGVVEYLCSGKVAANHDDFKEKGYDDCLQKINCTNDKDIFTHDFRLGKAYDDDIMPFTNYTYDFKGIIDYIFYSKDHMNLLGLLGPLEEEWFRQNKVVGCPHPHVASDHFSLLVEFEIPTQTLNGRSNNSSNHLKHR